MCFLCGTVQYFDIAPFSMNTSNFISLINNTSVHVFSIVFEGNEFSSGWMINNRFSWIYSSWRYLLKYFWSVTSTICTRIVLVCTWLCRLADLFEKRVFLWLNDQYSVFLDLCVLTLSAQILLICYFYNLYSDSVGLHLTLSTCWPLRKTRFPLIEWSMFGFPGSIRPDVICSNTFDLLLLQSVLG